MGSQSGAVTNVWNIRCGDSSYSRIHSKMNPSAHRGYLSVHVNGLFNKFIALPDFNLLSEEIINAAWCKNSSCVTAWTLIHILDSDPHSGI
jgi:hypothetical protein